MRSPQPVRRSKRGSSPVAAWRCFASKALDSVSLSADQQVGVSVVQRALQAPLRQIAANAGADASVVVNKVLESADSNFGYNAAADEYTDLLGAGVVDPTKVCRCALQFAASVSGPSC